jgi:ATP-dependent DNA helicase RecG
MTPYTDAQLEAMLADAESQLVERKRSAADGQGIRRNLCAFANDLPGHLHGGVIFVGVEDDGTPNGLSIDDRLLQVLSQMRSDGNILPPPTLSIEKRRLRGHDVAVLLVPPSQSPPVRYKGRVYVKVGPTTRVATEDEERQLAERRRAGDRPFDMRPAREATLADPPAEFVFQPTMVLVTVRAAP